MEDNRTFGINSGVRDADYTGNEARRSDYRSSSAWEFAAVNEDRDRNRGYSGQEYDRGYRDNDRGGYGEGGFGSRYAQSSYNRGRGVGGGGYGDYGQGNSGYGQNYGGARDRYYGGATGGQGYGGQSYGGGSNFGADDGRPYDGSYGSDGRRDWNGDGQRGNFRQQGSSWDRGGGQNHRDHGRDFRNQNPDDRGFFDRAGDEVRSWFGDEDAQRRREADQRFDEREQARFGHRDDHDYNHWRQSQIDAFDRDYGEYRQENRDKFANEFGAWRTERQGQRDQLGQVQEHQDVVGSDGEHVGTVDKVRGDRIILTKSDQDAGGRHHSIPSRWIQSVDAKQVTLRKSADEAKAHWRDEERNSAFFNENDTDDTTGSATSNAGGKTSLNRSFSGTY